MESVKQRIAEASELRHRDGRDVVAERIYEQVVKPLQEQVRLLTEQLDAVVVENAALKAAFNPEEIPEDAVEAFTETAIMDHDWDDTGAWSWVENDTDVIRAVLEALKPKTPATDAAIAALRAEALPPNIAEIIDSGELESILFASEASYSQEYRMAFYNFRQLRESKGANHE